MGITADFSGAMKKTATMVQLIPAARKQMTDWGAETQRGLMRSAASMQKSLSHFQGHKTSMMQNNIAFVVSLDNAGKWSLEIGTGVKGTKTVPYAQIQDTGGVTHPRVTKRSRAWAWYAFSQTGNEMFKGMALTKKSRLTVKVPRSNWFSSVIKAQHPKLAALMTDTAIYARAEKMAVNKMGK
jgi:hypothetical protein